ncbi:hypothetical protein [Streptomyces sp. NPDC048462]
METARRIAAATVKSKTSVRTARRNGHESIGLGATIGALGTERA